MNDVKISIFGGDNFEVEMKLRRRVKNKNETKN